MGKVLGERPVCARPLRDLPCELFSASASEASQGLSSLKEARRAILRWAHTSKLNESFPLLNFVDQLFLPCGDLNAASLCPESLFDNECSVCF